MPVSANTSIKGKFAHEPSLWSRRSSFNGKQGASSPMTSLILEEGSWRSSSTHHMTNEPRPSARISYCKWRTIMAWERGKSVTCDEKVTVFAYVWVVCYKSIGVALCETDAYPEQLHTKKFTFTALVCFTVSTSYRISQGSIKIWTSYGMILSCYFLESVRHNPQSASQDRC